LAVGFKEIMKEKKKKEKKRKEKKRKEKNGGVCIHYFLCFFFLIAVVLRLERAFDRDIDVRGLA
jgi:hypothetical protein